jgi:starch-binding outer membrane protein, SusD/RagB family
VRPLDATGLTMAQAVDIHFRERAYWLWMTSHRLGDMRRLIRQYGRNSETVFPTGQYFRNVQGGVYGPDVNFPLTVDERNNPEFAGFPSNQSLCLNRDA